MMVQIMAYQQLMIIRASSRNYLNNNLKNKQINKIGGKWEPEIKVNPGCQSGLANHMTRIQRRLSFACVITSMLCSASGQNGGRA